VGTLCGAKVAARPQVRSVELHFAQAMELHATKYFVIAVHMLDVNGWETQVASTLSFGSNSASSVAPLALILLR